jgi:hypothetical protein
MDPVKAGTWRQALGEGIADAAAERVDQVFFGMAVGRVVDPLAATALAAVRLEGVLEPRATTYARTRIGKCHWAPVFATPARNDLGPRCKPGPGTSTRYVDLTGFRTGAYRVNGVPGPQVNDPANESPQVAVMATFSNGLTANWGCSEAIQSLVS